MNKIVFVETRISKSRNEVLLKISGHIFGAIYGETIDEACTELLLRLDRGDTVYVDGHGIGGDTKKFLDKYFPVHEYTPQRIKRLPRKIRRLRSEIYG